jgi:hypothetical protein
VASGEPDKEIVDPARLAAARQSSMPSAHVSVLRDAEHYVFRSNEAGFFTADSVVVTAAVVDRSSLDSMVFFVYLVRLTFPCEPAFSNCLGVMLACGRALALDTPS